MKSNYVCNCTGNNYRICTSINHEFSMLWFTNTKSYSYWERRAYNPFDISNVVRRKGKVPHQVLSLTHGTTLYHVDSVDRAGDKKLQGYYKTCRCSEK